MEIKYEYLRNDDINYISLEFIKDGITYGIGVEENAPIKQVLDKLERMIRKNGGTK